MKRFLLMIIAVMMLSLTASCSSITNLANVLKPKTGGQQAGTPVQNPPSLRIAIDPGHGGIDEGAVGTDTGVPEAALNLEIATLLTERFRQAGADVLMTRESADVDYSAEGDTMKLKDMNNRVKLVGGHESQVLVSIHMNMFSDRTVAGAQVFYQNGSVAGKELAQSVQEALNAGANEAKKRSAHSGDYYLLKNISCPSVIVECGFLSNSSDELLLQDPEYQSTLADCIYEGICKYLGVE